MKLPKVDLFPGREDDLLILAALGIAGFYIATGGWARDRWMEAGAGLSAGAALLKTGKLAGKREGFKEGWDGGFNTLNPALHIGELLAQDSGFRGGEPDPPIVQKVVGAVAVGVAERAVERVMDEVLPSKLPEPEVLPFDGSVRQKARPAMDREERLQRKTVQQLKRMAREKGLGGSWLSNARKGEIIEMLLRA